MADITDINGYKNKVTGGGGEGRGGKINKMYEKETNKTKQEIWLEIITNCAVTMLGGIHSVGMLPHSCFKWQDGLMS